MILDFNCLEKYIKFSKAYWVATDKDRFFCSGPNCEEVFHTSEAVKNIVRCKACKRSTCSKCKMPNHGRITCDENPDRVFEKKWAKEIKIHTCPMCNTKLEKSSGCKHVFCTICHHSWCWTCGFPEKHIFHSTMFNGLLCRLVNQFTFGFEHGKSLHWTIRFILTIIAFCLAPAIFILIWLYMYFNYVAFSEEGSFQLLGCI